MDVRETDSGCLWGWKWRPGNKGWHVDLHSTVSPILVKYFIICLYIFKLETRNQSLSVSQNTKH